MGRDLSITDPAAAGAMALSGEAIARQLLEGGAQDALIAAGRLQAFEFISKISDAARVQTFLAIRESRNYRGLPYYDDGGRPGTIQTIEQFCSRYLGRSYRRLLQMTDDQAALGGDPDLYEAAQQVGFRARDYAALRALPDDDQEAVRTALAGDPQAAIDLLTDLVARQSARRIDAETRAVTAEARAAEVQADYAAATKLIGEKTAEVRKLQSERLTKPASIDESLRAWASLASAHIADARTLVAQVDSLREQAMGLAPPHDDAGRAAHGRGLRLLADAVAQLSTLAADLDRVLVAFSLTLEPIAYVEDGAND